MFKDCCIDEPANNQKQHAALEIKSPTSLSVRQKVHELRDQHGEYTQCTLGDITFNALVYKPEYRVQVLHHAVVCGFDKVLFVVANEFKPIYATMISVTQQQRETYIYMVTEHIYENSLKWAYTTAWDDKANPEQHFPDFREEAVTTPKYHVDHDTLAFHYAVWRLTVTMVEEAGMPLPIAKRIAPKIVCVWNKYKGRIDEMSEYLKKMLWYLSQATPKQQVTIREIKKVALNAFLAKKHAFNTLPPEAFQGRSFSQIRRALSKHEGTLSEFVLSLARTFRLLLPAPGLVPRSPFKR